MYAYPIEKPVTRQNAPLLIAPSAPQYAEQMEKLIAMTYGIPLEESANGISADKFRNHMRVFPEGQFIALDAQTHRVVGLTASMRIDFDPRYPLLESWVTTTNYG
jgi:hypothetical protein